MKSVQACGSGTLPQEAVVSKQQGPVRTHPTHNLGNTRVVVAGQNLRCCRRRRRRHRAKSMPLWWLERANLSKGIGTCSIVSLIGVTFLGLFQILVQVPQVEGGCREEARAACEAICVRSPYPDWPLNCTLRAVVILPASTVYEASLPKVLPVLELAEKRVKELQILPQHVDFKWIPYDDKCDASYATISAMDGYGKDCAHVLFGPACDYALASVGRIAKYFRSEGTPLLSVGGFSFNFQHTKQSCDDEFYMLIRTGMLGFQTIAELFVAMMKRYNWTQAVFFYDRDGQKNVAGLHTCHLMMNTLANFYRDANIIYSSFVTDSGTGNLTEDLTREVGLDHSTEVFCSEFSDVMISRGFLKFEQFTPTEFAALRNVTLYTDQPQTDHISESKKYAEINFSMIERFHGW